jgi:cAMP phosphodiesterase
VGDLSLAEMAGIQHVLLTHSHLDHIAALPLLLDATAGQRTQPLVVHALPQTLVALQAHIFNNHIWPDFTRIPSPQNPFVRFSELGHGNVISVAGKQVESLVAVHTVPACGYAVSAGGACWVFTGDTSPNDVFWRRLRQLKVGMLVIETAFSNREQALAERSMHLSPQMLVQELAKIESSQHFPVYITHTKPAETELIMEQIRQLDSAGRLSARHDLRLLMEGQTLVL